MNTAAITQPLSSELAARVSFTLAATADMNRWPTIAFDSFTKFISMGNSM